MSPWTTWMNHWPHLTCWQATGSSVCQTILSWMAMMKMKTKNSVQADTTSWLEEHVTWIVHSSLSHSLTHSHPLTHCLTHSLTHSHPLTHSLTHSHSPSLTHSLTHSLTLSLSHSHPHSLSHSLTPSLTLTPLTRSPLSLPPSSLGYRGKDVPGEVRCLEINPAMPKQVNHWTTHSNTLNVILKKYGMFLCIISSYSVYHICLFVDLFVCFICLSCWLVMNTIILKYGTPWLGNLSVFMVPSRQVSVKSSRSFQSLPALLT